MARMIFHRDEGPQPDFRAWIWYHPPVHSVLDRVLRSARAHESKSECESARKVASHRCLDELTRVVFCMLCVNADRPTGFSAHAAVGNALRVVQLAEDVNSPRAHVCINMYSPIGIWTAAILYQWGEGSL